jgi:hypothetical protein
MLAPFRLTSVGGLPFLIFHGGKLMAKALSPQEAAAMILRRRFQETKDPAVRLKAEEAARRLQSVTPPGKVSRKPH